MYESLRWKIPLILALMVAAVVEIVFGTLNLGFDLKGGVELRYQIKSDIETEGVDAEEVKRRREKVRTQTEKTLPVIRKRLDPTGTKQPDIRSDSAGELIVRFPGLTRAEVERIDKLVKQVGVLEFRVVVTDKEYAAMSEEERKQKDVQRMQLKRHDDEGRELEPELLWIQRSDEYNLSGERLERVFADQDRFGRPAVGFVFDDDGADVFSGMTQVQYEKGGRIAIILNGTLNSAPGVESKIGKRGIITGDFSLADVEDLVAVLQAGSLPVELELQSKTFVGPELGVDSRDRGYFAVKLSFALVVVFMFVYYLLSGAIADLALGLNLLFLFAAMMLTEAVLTLPGMAGVILTVGMAVDANVLIYERVREELDQGQALRFAIRNGYARAFTTILDANLTTLITAIILYWQGTGAVRGFAVTLSIGIVVSMFTALFVTRTVFDLLISRGWLRDRLTMLRLLRHTSIGFVKRAPFCIVLSVMLVGAGVATLIYRGHDNYGIDFASGTAMHLQLKGYVATCTKVTAAAQPKTSRFTVRFSERRPGGVEQPAELTKEIVEEGLRRLKLLPDQLMSEGARLKAELRKLKGDEKLRAERRVKEIDALHLESISFDGLTPLWEADKERFSAIELTVTEPMGGTGAGDALARFIDEMGERVFRKRMNIKEVRQIAADAGYGHADIQAAFRDENVVGQYVSDQFTVRVRASGEEQSQEEREKVAVDIEQAFIELVDHRGVETRVHVTPVREGDNSTTASGSSVRLSFFDLDAVADDNASVPVRLERTVIRRSLDKAGYDDAEINWSKDETKSYATVTFKTKNTDAAKIKSSLETPGVFAFPVAFEGTYFVGPGQARRIVSQAWWAAVLSLTAIIIYVWLRFGALKYGLAAVVALAHDVLFALGALAAAAWLAETPFGESLGIGDVRLSLPIVAGILTIIGYSLNDTIVVFDRVRENVRRRVRELRGRRSSGETLTPGIIDRSINQTLSRTLLTSLTTLIVCVTLYVAGGKTLHGLALCLIIGVLVGTYSSIFIASPILVLAHAVEVRRARAAGMMTTEEKEVARERGDLEKD